MVAEPQLLHTCAPMTHITFQSAALNQNPQIHYTYQSPTPYISQPPRQPSRHFQDPEVHHPSYRQLWNQDPSHNQLWNQQLWQDQTSSGDFNVFSNKKILEPDEDPIVFDGRTARDDVGTTCDDDGSGSDNDGAVFDLLIDDKETSSSYFSSGETHPTSVFSEGLTRGMARSQLDDLSPVAFDESEGRSSDSEEEQDKSPVIQCTIDGFPHKMNTYFRDPEPIQCENPHPVKSQFVKEESLGSNSKTGLKPSSPDLDAVIVHYQREQKGDATPKSDRRFDHSDLYTSQSSVKTVSGKDAEESSLDTGTALNFGALTGGLKSKGYRVPSYRQSTSGKLSIATQDEENTSSRIDKSSSAHILGIKSVADEWETSSEIETAHERRRNAENLKKDV